MGVVGGAYYAEEAKAQAACLVRAKELEALRRASDSGGAPGAFPADPLVVSGGGEGEECAVVVGAMEQDGLRCSQCSARAVCEIPDEQGLLQMPTSCLLLCPPPGSPPRLPRCPQALQCLNHDKSRSIKVFSHLSGDSALNNLAVLAAGIVLAAHAAAAVDAGALQLQQVDDGEAAAEGRAALAREAQEFLRFLADRCGASQCVQYSFNKQTDRTDEVNRQQKNPPPSPWCVPPAPPSLNPPPPSPAGIVSTSPVTRWRRRCS